MWRIRFYDENVRGILMDWPNKIKAKFLKIAELLEKHGPFELGMPMIRNMGRGLWEIRSKGQEGIGRACFCIVKDKQIIILHAFIKKTQETPQQHIETALKRANEVVKDERFKF